MIIILFIIISILTSYMLSRNNRLLASMLWITIFPVLTYNFMMGMSLFYPILTLEKITKLLHIFSILYIPAAAYLCRKNIFPERKTIKTGTVIVLLCIITYFLVRNLPPFSGDELMYHMTQPAQMLHEKNYNILRNFTADFSWLCTIWDFYPKGGSLQILLAALSFPLNSPQAFIQLLHLGAFGFILIALHRKGTLAAFLLVFTCPLFFLAIPMSIVDPLCSLYTTVCIIAASNYLHTRQLCWLWGVFFGMAAVSSVKLSGPLILLLLGICCALWLFHIAWKKGATSAITQIKYAIAIGVAGITGMFFGGIPWIIRNILHGHWPLYPLQLLLAPYKEVFNSSPLAYFFFTLLEDSSVNWTGQSLFTFESSIGFLGGAAFIGVSFKIVKEWRKFGPLDIPVLFCAIFLIYFLFNERNIYLIIRYASFILMITSFYILRFNIIYNTIILKTLYFGSMLNIIWSIPMLGTYVRQPVIPSFLSKAILSTSQSLSYVDELSYPNTSIQRKIDEYIEKGYINKVSIINYPFLSKLYGHKYATAVSVIHATSYQAFCEKAKNSEYILFAFPHYELTPVVGTSAGKALLKINLFTGAIFPHMAFHIHATPFSLEIGDTLVVNGMFDDIRNVNVRLYTTPYEEPLLLRQGTFRIERDRDIDPDNMYIALDILAYSTQQGLLGVQDLALSILKPDGRVVDVAFVDPPRPANLYALWMEKFAKKFNFTIKERGSHLQLYVTPETAEKASCSAPK